MFDDMNAQGRTVVMITHEDDVAERAKRVIRLIDGEIVEDRRQRGIREAPDAARIAAAAERHRAAGTVDRVTA